MTVGWLLRSCSNVRRKACLWWKLTNNVAIIVIGLSLEKCRLEVDMVERCSHVCAQLPRHAETWTTRSRRVGLLVILLFVLESFEDPTSFAFVKCSVLFLFDCEGLATLDEVLGLGAS